MKKAFKNGMITLGLKVIEILNLVLGLFKWLFDACKEWLEKAKDK